jgi:hypothetical protein
MRWCQQNWELNSPEDKMCYHLIRRNSSALGKCIWDIEKRWPYSSNDLQSGQQDHIYLAASDCTWNIAVLPVQVWIAGSCQSLAAKICQLIYHARTRQ